MKKLYLLLIIFLFISSIFASEIPLGTGSSSSSTTKKVADSDSKASLYDRRLSEISSANEEIVQLLSEAKFERELILEYGEYVRDLWKKGKDVTLQLILLQDEKIHCPDASHYVAWSISGAKKIPNKRIANIPKNSYVLIDAISRNIELNSILHQAKREIFSISVIARMALQSMTANKGSEANYISLLGRNGISADTGAHASNVDKFLKWIKDS